MTWPEDCLCGQSMPLQVTTNGGTMAPPTSRQQEWPTFVEFLNRNYPNHQYRGEDESAYWAVLDDMGLGSSKRTLTGASAEGASPASRAPRLRSTMPSGKLAPTR